VRRREDPRFLTGKGRYVDDLPVEGVLHATFVRSPWAHARITGVDTSAAAAIDGVQVFAAADTDLGVNPLPPFIAVDERMFRPIIAREKVRFAGDIVGVVLAPTRGASVDASELVEVEYEPLPHVTDMRDAVKDEVLLYEDVGTNVALRIPPKEPDEGLFDGCDAVASGSFLSQRIAACPIEPRATAARFEDGRLTIWLSTQTPHQDRMVLGMLLGLGEENVRVVAPDVGGGFGGKGLDVEDVILGWLARATGTPIRWTETRSENLVAMHHGRAQRVDFEIGGTRDGTVKALRLKILQDAGAYPGLGVLLPTFTAMMSSGVYRIPKIETEITAVVTNTTSTGPVRGAGRPEATQVLERAIDVFAGEISMDPADVRKRNFIPPDAFPYATVTGAHYDIGDYEQALDRALDAVGYSELRAEQERRRKDSTSRQLGIGMSTYVEITNGIAETEYGAVEITAEGHALVKTGSFSHGQGHETTFAQIASDRLGIPIERITVIKGDTDAVPRGTGTYGSKSTQIGGAAARQASEELVEKAKELAASELEASPQDMQFDVEQGRFHVAGSPQPALDWAELSSRLEQQGRLAELAAETDFTASQPTFPFGAHIAVVEVDTETGSVDLQRMIAVDDAGRIINPLIVDGQVHGGVVAGIAQALFEEILYDEDGNPASSNLVSYCMPAAPELPYIERVEMETPTPINALGAKGIGESGTIGSTPAVLAAVIDALAPLGVRDIEMPANGERVWRAIQEARGANGGG
jgi:aerobic carbon-monoxide dehydrogenase large subunit